MQGIRRLSTAFASEKKQRRANNAYQRRGGMLRTDVFSVERGPSSTVRYRDQELAASGTVRQKEDKPGETSHPGAGTIARAQSVFSPTSRSLRAARKKAKQSKQSKAKQSKAKQSKAKQSKTPPQNPTQHATNNLPPHLAAN
jgi:hypothetical protein